MVFVRCMWNCVRRNFSRLTYRFRLLTADRIESIEASITIAFYILSVRSNRRRLLLVVGCIGNRDDDDV